VTAVATATVFDHALRKMIDTAGAVGAAVYLLEPDRPVLKVAAALGDRATDGAPWAVEMPWGTRAASAAASEPLPDVENDGTRLTVPMLLGDEAVGAVVVSMGARVSSGVDTNGLLLQGRTLARALAPAPLEALRDELGRRIPAPAREWLETGLAAAARGERDPILTAFPAMGRRLGREPLGSRSALVLGDGDVEVPLRSWRLDDAGRVALLCAFAGDAEALARELYFTGDLRERCGALRGLAVLGRTPGAVDAVRDALRTSAVELFEAALADNPYAGRFLPDDEFRHAVLKAAFVGVSIARLPGVEARADAELSRMLLSYVTEREVAGRSVPPDIWPVAALHPTPGLAAKLCGYLEHPAAAHRTAAALGLGRIGDPHVRPFLNDRLAREDDRTVRRIIERALV
jgi:hypothetical protein